MLAITVSVCCICLYLSFLSSSSFCIWPAAINPVFAKANRSVCYPNWIFAQPNLMFAQAPLSFLRWNIEH